MDEVHNINYDDNTKMKKIVNYPKDNKFIRELYSAFQFEWEGLSSGEFNLLNMFARIDSELEKLKSKNVIILLDEIDVGFHPEWQRCIVMLISEYIENQKDLKGKRVQVILTTHSPIPLSDVLREDTLIFKKNSKRVSTEKTFGQNIHTLFKETFLLKNTIGSFSNKIIDDLLFVLSLNFLSPLDDIKRILSINYDDERKQLEDYKDALENFYQVNEEYFEENIEKIHFLLKTKINDIDSMKLVEDYFSKTIEVEDVFMFNIRKKFPFIRENFIYEDLRLLIDSIGEKVYKSVLFNLLDDCVNSLPGIKGSEVDMEIIELKNKIQESQNELEKLLEKKRENKQ